METVHQVAAASSPWMPGWEDMTGKPGLAHSLEERRADLQTQAARNSININIISHSKPLRFGEFARESTFAKNIKPDSEQVSVHRNDGKYRGHSNMLNDIMRFIQLHPNCEKPHVTKTLWDIFFLLKKKKNAKSKKEMEEEVTDERGLKDIQPTALYIAI